MYMRNRRSPQTEPCGTTEWIGFQPDYLHYHNNGLYFLPALLGSTLRV